MQKVQALADHHRLRTDVKSTAATFVTWRIGSLQPVPARPSGWRGGARYAASIRTHVDQGTA